MVLHFGANEWDGPLSLHEMMAIKNENLLNFVQDYQIHLIDPAKLSKEDLEKFSTSLREVIGYIKYSKDKTDTSIEIPKETEVIDVCKAVEDMMNESKTEGAVAVLAGLVKDGLLSIKEAAHRANMTESAFEAEVKKLS